MKTLYSQAVLSMALLLAGLFSVQRTAAQPVSIDEPGLTPNEIQARRLFNQSYNQVFGPQGCTFTFDVNIAKLFKNRGTIWMKDKKTKSISSRSITWNDGKKVYVVRHKKKVVEVYDPSSPKKDKYSSHFKFEPRNYHYSIATDGNDLLITLKLKKKAKGMKELKAWVDRQTMAPKRLRIKVAFLRANVYISGFRSGRIDDGVFEFPRQQYQGWEMRNEEF